MSAARVTSLDFFGGLRWIDGRPLLDHVEPYRRRIFALALDERAADGRAAYNLILTGRAKKNWKSADLVLAGLFALIANDSPGGNQCYLLANDEGQAGDDLTLAKKLIAVNALLAERLVVRQKTIERADGAGFLMILPAQDVAGAHGKTYRLCGFDEIHGYRTWDLLEAMQLDPTRPDAQMWITSYASLYHKPGVPLFDMIAQGRAGQDPRMFFSWYAADFTTDPDIVTADPEARANPSRGSWADVGYLDQQRRRLPAHKFRRLHLNLPGLPEGSAFQVDMAMQAFTRGVRLRPPAPGVTYSAFADHSHGSDDDATIGIGHDLDGRKIVDLVMNQGQAPPFSMVNAIPRFAVVLHEYRIATISGDNVGAETYQQEWEKAGIAYRLCERTTSENYEALEPLLNRGVVDLPDQPELESQLLGLIWKGSKITHPSGEHDDWATAAAGVVAALASSSRCQECDESWCSGMHISVLGEPRPSRRREEPEGARPESLLALIADAVEPDADEVFGDPSLDVVIGVAQNPQEPAALVVIRDGDVAVLLRHRAWSAAVSAAEVAAQIRAWAGEFRVVEIHGDSTARAVLDLVRDVAPVVGEREVAGGTLRERLRARQVVLYAAAGLVAAAERAEREGAWPAMLRALTVTTLAAFARRQEVRA